MLELSYLNQEDIVLKADFAQVNLSEGVNRIQYMFQEFLKI